MTPSEVSSVMDQAVDSLRNLHSAAQKTLDDKWWVAGGKEPIQAQLNDVMTRINYLDTELHQQVLRGEKPFSVFADIANNDAQLLQNIAGYAGKWAMAPFLQGVALDTGANIASGLKAANEQTGNLLSAAKWIVVGVVVWKAAEIIGIFAPAKKQGTNA